MPVELRYDGAIIRGRVFGNLSMVDFNETIAYVSQVEVESGMAPNRLFDIREIESSDLGFVHLRSIADSRRRVAFPNPFKNAVVFANETGKGFGRMFQDLLDHPQVTIELFDDVTKAEEWLRT